MILRKLEREPFKAALSCFGIALAVAVLVVGGFGMDSLAVILDVQFHLAQRQDMTVTFVEPASAGAIHEVAHLPGVLHAEPFRAVPARLRFGPRSRRLAILGVEPGSTLFHVLDERHRRVSVPPEGLVLSTALATLLAADVGDRVTVEVMEGERPRREVPVTALISEYAGTNAYMDAGALHRLMREAGDLSGAYLATDPRATDALYRKLKETPRVAAVTVKDAMIDSFNRTVAENQTQMQSIMVMFASVIAVGVVYNTARISLTERSRELATLRVVGFTRFEISVILLGELAVLTIVAVPLGLVLGYGLAALTVRGFETEMYRFPLVVSRSTFGFAALVTVAASVVSALIVRRRLDRLDLVAVLKSKE
jgi:putative ABC transport system permease protein